MKLELLSASNFITYALLRNSRESRKKVGRSKAHRFRDCLVVKEDTETIGGRKNHSKDRVTDASGCNGSNRCACTVGLSADYLCKTIGHITMWG